MTEILRLVDQLERVWDGDAWHGPPLRKMLDTIDAPTAAAHPIAGGHSIWELVEHIHLWVEAVTRRVGGEEVEYEDGGDWPAAPARTTPAAWRRSLARLETDYGRLVEVVRGLDPAVLDARVPGKDYSVYVLLHGIVQHTLYHAGQIAIVRRAALAGLQQRPR